MLNPVLGRGAWTYMEVSLDSGFGLLDGLGSALWDRDHLAMSGFDEVPLAWDLCTLDE